MGNQQFTNNATSLLAGTITNASTTVQLTTGAGALFPSITGTEYFVVSVQDTSGDIEYMKVTAVSGDNLTVVRGYEGSTAIGFTANLARVELRDTAGTLSGFVQKSGDTLTGALNGGGFTSTNITLGSGCSIESATEIVNTPLRGATGVTTNEIVVPTNGSAATMGGVPILTGTSAPASFSYGMIMMWNASVPDIPTGWALCDGTNGTPNLEGLFIVGAGNTYTLGSEGTYNATTSAVSAGTPAFAAFTLTTAQLPAHAHPFDYFFGNSTTVIGNPGFAAPAGYMFGGSGTGTRVSYTGSTVGTGAPITPTGSPLAAHSHSVAAVPYYGLYYIMYVG